MEGILSESGDWGIGDWGLAQSPIPNPRFIMPIKFK